MYAMTACGKIGNQRNVAGENDNPYFSSEIENVAYSYCKELCFEGKVRWNIELLECSEYGSLYRTAYDWIEGSIDYYADCDKDFYTEMIHEGWEWFFWVTDDCIYYFNDLSDEEKEALTESGNLPPNSLLVCQEKELPDKISEGETGHHEWIEKHNGDIICYRSFSIYDEIYKESGDILQFVWKKDVGLIGFRYARTPAGGGSLIIWDPQYLQRGDMGFDIDGL